MAKGYGNLLLTVEGMETSHIPEADRERAVVEFYNMKAAAERRYDRFYALEAVFGYTFSYGTFYPNFYNMTWNEFQACPSLKGIGQRAFELMQGFCQNPNVATLIDEAAFDRKDEPRALTGYSNPQAYPVFVGDRMAWEMWHRKWYAEHPSDIDWEATYNDWLPRLDLVLEILRRELRAKFREEGLAQAEIELYLSRIENKDVANVFHDEVMRFKGGQLEAYASKIGGEICLRNYYTYEAELSVLERQYAKSLREIYSIVNKAGDIQFISIDFGHGMFEFHDKDGKHQGEYRFDGSFNSVAEDNHSLKCIELWRRRTGR